MTSVSLRLDDKIISRLDRLARRTGRTKTFYMTEAINEKLEDMEDLYLAEKRTRDLQSGKSSTVSLEDVIKSYGMAD